MQALPKSLQALFFVAAIVACASCTRSEPVDDLDRGARDLGCARAQLTKGSFGENHTVVYGCGKCAVYGHPLGLWGLDERITDPKTLQLACGPDASAP